MVSCREVNGASKVGDTIRWETTVSGAVGQPSYTYSLYMNGYFSDLVLGSADNHYSYQATSAGTYYIKVTVRDSRYSEVEYVGDTVTITAAGTTPAPSPTPTPRPLTVVSCMEVNGASKVGDTIRWETIVSGAVGTPSYSYSLYRNGNFSDLVLSSADNHYSCEATVAGTYYIEVTVRDSRSASVEYVGDTVTITADTTPTDPPTDYEALPAPTTQAVPASVGMKAVYSGVTDKTITLSLLINNTFGEGLTDYGLSWQREGGSLVKSSVRFGDVSGATFNMTISGLSANTLYTVRGYVVKAGVTLLSEGFKVRTKP